MGMESSHDGIPDNETQCIPPALRLWREGMDIKKWPARYAPQLLYTWTVLEPHSFRSLWIFRCRPKNHFWAKSDGFNDTVLVSKSWSFASFLRHFASYFWSFQSDWQRAESAIVRFLVAHYFSVQTKKCSFKITFIGFRLEFRVSLGFV